MFCSPGSRSPQPTRRGLTLIELLIAITVTVVVLLAMIQAFKVASSQIALGRASMSAATALQTFADHLRNDLKGLTVTPRMWDRGADSSGYLEYVEGPLRDSVTAGTANSYYGDADDILAMTVRSEGRPFRGRYVDPNNPNTPQIIESYLAEIIWYTRHDDRDQAGDIDYDESTNLYRRVLLIRPDLTTSETNFNSFFAENDISVRRSDPGDPTSTLVANTLNDLTRRENRFAHNGAPSGFPHAIDRSILAVRPLAGIYEGEDLMLTDVAAFDVKAFSPNAEVKGASNVVIEPSDPGYTAVAGPTQAQGAYVDLNYLNDPYAGTPAIAFDPTYPWFSTGPTPRSQLYVLHDLGDATKGYDVAWCTWSPHYETDLRDQDLGLGDSSGPDQGTNGLDDDPYVNGVDDAGERETEPPYPYALRSIQVIVRVVEKNTDQVRQTTVKHGFAPD